MRRRRISILEIELPRLSGGLRIQSTIERQTIADIRKEFAEYQALPMGGQGRTEIEYEGATSSPMRLSKN